MRLTFLGKATTGGPSPTLYATDRKSYVVQGWIVPDGGRVAGSASSASGRYLNRTVPICVGRRHSNVLAEAGLVVLTEPMLGTPAWV